MSFFDRLPHWSVQIVINVFIHQIGELIGGSQREERLEFLENRLDELNLSKESYWWYLDLRRFGSGYESFFTPFYVMMLSFFYYFYFLFFCLLIGMVLTS